MGERSMDRWRAMWSLGLRPRSAGAFCFAIVCVAIATGVRAGLGFISPDTTVYATFYSATLVAALAGGTQAGVLAGIMGGVVGFALFIPEEWGSSPFMLPHVVSFGLYGVSSAVIIWAAESYRGLLRRLQAEQGIRQLLNRELAHRMKNSMATVQAVVVQTLREHKDLRDALSARIAALAATNGLLMQSEWHHASLREILAAELAPYDFSRIKVTGEDVECPPSLAVYAALAIHELTTNAAKHGALSGVDGRVEIAWTRIGDRLELQWSERGGRKPTTERREGFGTKLLQSGVGQFNGWVSTRFEADGLRCKIELTIPAQLQRGLPAVADRACADRNAAPARSTSAAEAGQAAMGPGT
jgi:two-component sensor histidine kinase